MRFPWKSRRLARELRRDRPRPDESLVRQIEGARPAGRRRVWMRPTAARAALAATLIAVGAAAFAGAGGFSQAAESIDGVVELATRAANQPNNQPNSQPNTNNQGSGQDQYKVTICHRTGSRTNPYVEITVSGAALEAHMRHEGDIIPAPPGGCPTTAP